jgi:hypothetical protein
MDDKEMNDALLDEKINEFVDRVPFKFITSMANFSFGLMGSDEQRMVRFHEDDRDFVSLGLTQYDTLSDESKRNIAFISSFIDTAKKETAKKLKECLIESFPENERLMLIESLKRSVDFILLFSTNDDLSTNDDPPTLQYDTFVSHKEGVAHFTKFLDAYDKIKNHTIFSKELIKDIDDAVKFFDSELSFYDSLPTFFDKDEHIKLNSVEIDKFISFNGLAKIGAAWLSGNAHKDVILAQELGLSTKSIGNLLNQMFSARQGMIRNKGYSDIWCCIGSKRLPDGHIITIIMALYLSDNKLKDLFSIPITENGVLKHRINLICDQEFSTKGENPVAYLKTIDKVRISLEGDVFLLDKSIISLISDSVRFDIERCGLYSASKSVNAVV